MWIFLFDFCLELYFLSIFTANFSGVLFFLLISVVENSIVCGWFCAQNLTWSLFFLMLNCLFVCWELKEKWKQSKFCIADRSLFAHGKQKTKRKRWERIVCKLGLTPIVAELQRKGTWLGRGSMKGGRKNLKRAAEEQTLTLQEGQSIMQVVSLRGSNLIEVPSLPFLNINLCGFPPARFDRCSFFYSWSLGMRFVFIYWLCFFCPIMHLPR